MDSWSKDLVMQHESSADAVILTTYFVLKFSLMALLSVQIFLSTWWVLKLFFRNSVYILHLYLFSNNYSWWYKERDGKNATSFRDLSLLCNSTKLSGQSFFLYWSTFPGWAIDWDCTCCNYAWPNKGTFLLQFGSLLPQQGWFPCLSALYHLPSIVFSWSKSCAQISSIFHTFLIDMVSVVVNDKLCQQI